MIPLSDGTKNIPFNGYALRLLFAVVMLLSAGTAFPAPSIDATAEPLPANLTSQMAAFETRDEDALSLAQALVSDQWQPVSEAPGILQSPRRLSTLWLKASVVNTGGRAMEWWVELLPWRLQQVDAWLVDEASGEVVRHISTGSEMPLDERAVDSLRTVVPLMVPARTSLQLVMRIRSEHRPYLTVTAWDPVAFTSEEASRYQLHMVLLAIVLTLVGILLLQFDLRYLLPGAWMLLLFLLQAEKEGYLSLFLFNSLADPGFNLRFILSLLEKAVFLTAGVHLLGLARIGFYRGFLFAAWSVAVLAILVGFSWQNNALRVLASCIHILFVLTWLAVLPGALWQRRKWQRTLLVLLTVSWLVSTFFIISFAFDIDYPSGLVPWRTGVQVSVILGLLLVYARQKHDYEQTLKHRLWHRDQVRRRWLEQTVAERTRELDAALEAAQAANARKADFLGRVTHDLKSPLTSILGYAQLLRVEPGQTGQVGRTIYSSARHVLNMVSRLIDRTWDMTRGEPYPSNLYLYAFLEDVGNEARILASNTESRFELHLSESLSPVIHCDETFLREIFLNLIEVACECSAGTDVHLHVGSHGRSGPGGWCLELECLLEHTGDGLSGEQRYMITMPRVAITEETGNAGAGIRIARELAEKLGGSVKLLDDGEPGIAIRVRLPVTAGEEVEDSGLLKAPGYLLPRVQAQGLEAWVVEDAPAIGKLLAIELENLGFDVRRYTTAEDLQLALKDRAGGPDLILTDYRLPGASGDAVLEAARRQDARLPVILLSATRPMQFRKGDRGAKDYTACLGKPVDLVDLRRTVAKACGLPITMPLSDPETPDTAQEHQVTLNATTLAQLYEWLELGAVTDLVEWCDRLAEQAPAYAGVASEWRSLAERGDFATLERRFKDIGAADDPD